MKQISLLLIILFVSIEMHAQGNKKDKMEEHSKTYNMSEEHIDSEAHAMMYADKVTTRLNLSLEQKERIKEAQLQRLESQKAMMTNLKGEDNAEMKEIRIKIQADFKEKMKDILSPVKYKEWEPIFEREKRHPKKKHKNKEKETAGY